MGRNTIRFVIAANPPQRLDKALSRDVPENAALSRTRLARLIATGAVAVAGEVVTDLKARVAEGDAVAITVEEAGESHIGAQAIALDVVHEDDDLIVIDKPAGLVVHPAPGSPDGTLVNALLHHCGDSLSGVGGVKRPGIVHRIDKDTSGLLVVAKNDRAHRVDPVDVLVLVHVDEAGAFGPLRVDRADAVGERFALTWGSEDDWEAEEFLDAMMTNYRSLGATVVSVETDDDTATAVISGFPDEDLTETFGVAAGDAAVFHRVAGVIAKSRGLVWTTELLDEGDLRFTVTSASD